MCILISVLPTCSSYFVVSYLPPFRCSYQQAYLASSSFNGIPLTGQVDEHWQITSADDRSNVVLNVHDFDISCRSGSLSMGVQGAQKKYCNRNRPVGELISQFQDMRVIFVSTYGQSPTSRSDFFLATYRLDTYNRYVMDFVDVLNITGM